MRTLGEIIQFFLYDPGDIIRTHSFIKIDSVNKSGYIKILFLFCCRYLKQMFKRITRIYSKLYAECCCLPRHMTRQVSRTTYFPFFCFIVSQ